MSTQNQNKVQPYEGEDAKADTKVTATVSRGAKEKAPNAFRTISEVADEMDVPQHVLRFWETKFTQIKPLKRGGGRRYYRPEDVALLKRIHNLLYTEGYTIKGVQKLLKGQGKGAVAEAPAQAPVAVAAPSIAVVSSAPRTSAVAEALLAKVDEAMVEQPKGQKAPLSSKQKAILEAMLGDLKDLRAMIRNEE